jgi:hypothetical protein
MRKMVAKKRKLAIARLKSMIELNLEGECLMVEEHIRRFST